jgi:hypothetical protein
MKTNIHFLSYLAQFFLDWEMFQTKVVEKITTHVLCSITPPPLQNRAVYEIMWKYIIERGRPQMKIWYMRIACWIPKATNIHSGCVILTALLQWLHVRTAVLHYTFIACFVLFEVLKFFISTFLHLRLSQNIHPVLSFYSTICVSSSWEMNATGMGCGGCGLDSSGSCYGFHFLVKPKVKWRVCVSYIFLYMLK